MPNVSLDRWQTVRSGLTWIIAGLLMMFVAAIGLIAALVWVVFFSGNPRVAAVETLPPMLWVIVLLFVGGHLFDVIGILRCLVVPVPRLLGWIIGHLVCFLSSMGLIALAVFLQMRMAGPGEIAVIVIILGFVNSLLSLATAILMGMFLRGIARHFSDDSTARHCGQYIACQVFFWLLATGGGFVPIVFDSLQVRFISREMAIVAIAILLGSLALLLFFWYFDLLSRTRQTIRQGPSMQGELLSALPIEPDASSGRP